MFITIGRSSADFLCFTGLSSSQDKPRKTSSDGLSQAVTTSKKHKSPHSSPTYPRGIYASQKSFKQKKSSKKVEMLGQAREMPIPKLMIQGEEDETPIKLSLTY